MTRNGSLAVAVLQPALSSCQRRSHNFPADVLADRAAHPGDALRGSSPPSPESRRSISPVSSSRLSSASRASRIEA